MAAPSSLHTKPSQTTMTSATIQPSMACGPPSAVMSNGIVMNGPIPIMLIMLSAVAWTRPKRRGSGESVIRSPNTRRYAARAQTPPSRYTGEVHVFHDRVGFWATNTDKSRARIPSIIPRMKRFMTLVLGAAVMGAGATVRTQQPNAPQIPVAKPAMAVAHNGTTSSESQTAVITQYCAGCHNDRTKAGQLTLAAFDVADPAHSAEVAEKMIRKLRAGLMPPPGSRRPDEAALAGLADTLSAHADARATEFTPGRRTFQRLNRAEYARSIHDLLALDVNAGDYLPLDAKSANFDNIADAQLLSPTLMQAYLTAAAEISRLAVGDAAATAREATYGVSRWTSQREHVEGAPYGTRGGVSVQHTFPADGDYRFRASFYHETTGALYGNGRAALHTADAASAVCKA